MHLWLSDLVAAAVSRLSAAPLISSPLAAVQTSETRHKRLVLVAPQQFSTQTTQPAELQLGQRGCHVFTHTLTHPPSCSYTPDTQKHGSVCDRVSAGTLLKLDFKQPKLSYCPSLTCLCSFIQEI